MSDTNTMQLSLTEAQARVLYEILNLSGLPLTNLEADYGTDSVEEIVSRLYQLDEVDVGRVGHRMFTLLGQMLEQFQKEREL